MNAKKTMILLVLLGFLSSTAAEAFPFFGGSYNTGYGGYGGYRGYDNGWGRCHHHRHHRHCRW